MMSIDCRCGPCPFDIRTLGYMTAKEDPAFEGTHCLWHEVIPGRSLSICVAGGTPISPIFALDNDGTMTHFGLDKVEFYAKEIGAKRA